MRALVVVATRCGLERTSADSLAIEFVMAGIIAAISALRKEMSIIWKAI
jgi:menaquinone-dependent protoporphyrinogen IX oxidase